jgi:hypothetical protein
MAFPVDPSDLNDDEWKLLAPLIPTSQPRGRPHSSDRRHARRPAPETLRRPLRDDRLTDAAQEFIVDNAPRADLRRLDALYEQLRPYGADGPPPTAEAVSDGVLAAARVAETLEALLRERAPLAA